MNFGWEDMNKTNNFKKVEKSLLVGIVKLFTNIKNFYLRTKNLI